MRQPSIIPRRLAALALLLLVLFVLIAAVVNVPWALTRMRMGTTKRQVPMAQLEGAGMPRTWPIETPHDTPWPAPDYWYEGSVLGCRVFDVRASSPDQSTSYFQLDAQHLGWPFAVIEEKQMWWNWDDPTLRGAENDPPPSLKIKGLLLNPLIVGGAAWMVLVLPWVLGISITRWSRRRRNRCMACGYPVGTSSVCTECGSQVAPRS